MIAYLITSGTYSDYSVNHVFLDKALAEEYIEKIKTLKIGWHWDYDIEEYEIRDRLPEFVTVYTVRWSETIYYKNNTTKSDYIEETSEVRALWPGQQIRRIDANVGGRPGTMVFTATSPILQLAHQSVADRVAAYKAEQAGLT